MTSDWFNGRIYDSGHNNSPVVGDEPTANIKVMKVLLTRRQIFLGSIKFQLESVV